MSENLSIDDPGDLQDTRKTLLIFSENRSYCAELDRAVGFEFQVLRESDVQDAMRSASDNSPALVIVDEDTSAGKDLEFIRFTQSDIRIRNTPIVYTIGQGTASGSKEIKDIASVLVLAKPYKKSALFKALQKQSSRSVEASWENLEPVQKRALQDTLSAFNDIADAIASSDGVDVKAALAHCEFLDEAIRNNRVQDLLRGIRGHDTYSYVHSVQIATFLGLLGKFLGIKGDDLNVLTSGGLLHDVGKLSIPHEVLNKPGNVAGWCDDHLTESGTRYFRKRT